MKSDNLRVRALKKMECFWEGHSLWICILLGILTGVLHYSHVLVNIRQTIGNMITFSSIVIGVNGIFLTLLITLQESPAFKRLRVIFPTFQTKLYIGLKSQIQYGLIVVTFSIMISMLPESPSIFLSVFGILIYFTFFWLMTLESFYTVKLVTDIIVKNFNIPTRSRRE